MEAGVVLHVDSGHVQQSQLPFGLPRPEIPSAWRLPAGFGKETEVQCDEVMPAAVLLHQAAVEFQEIERFFELNTVALFTIFAAPFLLPEVDPALGRTEQSHGLDHETLPACVDTPHV